MPTSVPESGSAGQVRRLILPLPLFISAGALHVRLLEVLDGAAFARARDTGNNLTGDWLDLTARADRARLLTAQQRSGTEQEPKLRKRRARAGMSERAARGRIGRHLRAGIARLRRLGRPRRRAAAHSAAAAWPCTAAAAAAAADAARAGRASRNAVAATTHQARDLAQLEVGAVVFDAVAIVVEVIALLRARRARRRVPRRAARPRRGFRCRRSRKDPASP